MPSVATTLPRWKQLPIGSSDPDTLGQHQAMDRAFPGFAETPCPIVLPAPVILPSPELL